MLLLGSGTTLYRIYCWFIEPGSWIKGGKRMEVLDELVASLVKQVVAFGLGLRWYTSNGSCRNLQSG